MNKLKCAVVGAGYLGKFHAEKYASLDECELVAVVDLDKKSAAKCAKKNSCEALTDYKELFGKVDAVSVVTPTKSHYEIGSDFLSNGVHVLIEKPITATVEEARLLIEAADKSGKVLQVGHLERFNSAVKALRDGRLTKPMFIESHRLSPFPYRSTDVCVVLDLMIHDIDIILNLVDSEVESVDAVGIPVISKKVDIANARIRFKNGCVANVTASRVSKETQRKIRIFQSDAYISIDYAAQHISIYRKEEGGLMGLPKITTEELDIEKKDSLLEEIRSFVNTVATGAEPVVTGRDGLRALEVASLVQEGMGQTIEGIISAGAAGSAGGAGGSGGKAPAEDD